MKLIPKLSVLILTICCTASCTVQRKIRKIEEDCLTAELSIPGEEMFGDDIEYHEQTENISDTISYIDEKGKRLYFFPSTIDSTGTIQASDILQEAVVTARFKNVAERKGMINIAFDITVPQRLTDSEWQIRLTPELKAGKDTITLEEILITGAKYREKQIRSSELYERFLSGIITDSTELFYNRLLRTFICRNIPELPAPEEAPFHTETGKITGEYGISAAKAAEYYRRWTATYFNDRKIRNTEKMRQRYLDDTIRTERIRLDSVPDTEGTDDIRYCYTQSVRTQKGLKKVTVQMKGGIYKDGRRILDIMPGEPLTFYISSFSTLADDSDRFITEVIERTETAHTSAFIDYRSGSYRIEEDLKANRSELMKLKRGMDSLMKDSRFTVDSLIVTAACSPEGAYERNRKLAAERGAEIIRYLKKHLTSDTEGNRKNNDLIFKQYDIAEDWENLESLVRNDSLLQDRKGLLEIMKTPDPDIRENRLKQHPEYTYLKQDLYPLLRCVRFSFHLHRKGMLKDTIHTAVIDLEYRKGIEALKERRYEDAVRILGRYRDLNSAVAFMAMEYDASARHILESLPSSAKRDYLLAVLYSRYGNEEEAVRCFMEAKTADPSLFFRGNLDPEISRLIRKYHITNY